VPGIDAETFEKRAEEAKRNYCPVSKALQAVEITLTARLI
jgi:organic hydroperoxide reductase OsmC/OhrA